MTRFAVAFSALVVVLAACKKDPAPAPAPVAVPVKKAPIAAPPPVVAAPSLQPVTAAAADPNEGNWWSKKAPGEKQEIMEGWLHQYQMGNAAAKAAQLKQIQNCKLSAADKAMMETLRARFKYPPMPLQ